MPNGGREEVGDFLRGKLEKGGHDSQGGKKQKQ